MQYHEAWQDMTGEDMTGEDMNSAKIHSEWIQIPIQAQKYIKKEYRQ